MNGNATTRHSNAALLSVASTMADRVTTSASIDEKLLPVLKRLKMPTGLLQRVAGVHERRNWGPDQSFDDAAIDAGRRALAEAGVRPDQVGLLINTSVTRPHLEPSVAVRLHHGLGLPSSATNFDIANACLGFVNGMTLASQLIDAGQIDYAVIIDGEDADDVQVNTIDRLLTEGFDRDDFMSEFASLTLGSGAAAAVIGRADRHPEDTASSAGSPGRPPRTTTSASAASTACSPMPRPCSSAAWSSSSRPGRRRSATGTGRAWTATSCTR
nr:hypothetical protein GCM10025699_65060 [Microbacterium flavescens]